MNLQTILLSSIGVILTAIVSWIAERLIILINSKLANTKYAKMLTSAVDVITRAVKTTYQTYVQSLKDKNMFTEEAQKEALKMAKEMAITQMSAESKKWAETNFGDIKQWVTVVIESVIYDLKNNAAGDKQYGSHTAKTLPNENGFILF